MDSVSHPLIAPTNRSQRLAMVLGLIISGCGLLVMLGWALQISPMVQPRPNLEPIKFNTALCYTLLGLGVFGMARSRAPFAGVACLMAAAIALLSIAQYPLNADFGLDQLFLSDHLANPSAKAPGRMSLIAGLCLLIASLSLNPVVKITPLRQAVMQALAGSLLIAVGGASIVGFVLNLPDGLGWATHGSLSTYSGGFSLLLGGALLTIAWRLHSKTTNSPPGWMPLPVIVASGSLTLILWLSLRERENFYTSLTTRNAIESYSRDVNLEIERQSSSLGRIALRWSLLEGSSAVVREADAITYVNEAPGAQSLAWLDPQGRTRWFYPLTGNEGLGGYEHTREPVRAESLRLAKLTSLPNVSETLEIPTHGKGFSIYAPVLTLGGVSGFASADFTYEQFFNKLDRRLRTGDKHDYTVEIEDTVVFDSRGRIASDAIPDALVEDYQIFGRRIRISLSPSLDRDAITRRRLPEVALVTGLGITFLLGLSVHLARVARAGQRQTEDANTKLRAEVEERRQAELALRASQLAERKLGLVAARTDNIVVIARPDGGIEWVNEAFTRVFGPTLREIAGQPAIELLAAHDSAAALRLRDSADKGEAIACDVACRARSGRRYDLSVDLQPVYAEDNHLEYLILLAVDVTQRVETERELRRAKIEADAASRAKSDFLASMSHEIRTPMNGVIGMTSLLLHTNLDADQRDSVNTIRQSGETLLTIINDILDFSKIESGHLELELIPFDLAACVEETADLFAPVAASRGIDLAYRVDPNLPAWIEGDPTRLRQILANLINNAVKFTPTGSVSVELQLDPSRARTIIGRVRDTGIGIPQERADRLFKPFSQVDSSTTRKYGGTGLGLAICYRLTQLLGGHIEVASMPGEGSTFSFTIPLRPANAPASPPLPPLPSTKPVTLVLESHPLNRRRFTEQLAAHFGPVLAPDTPAQLEKIIEDSPLKPSVAVIDSTCLARPADHDLSLRVFRSLGIPILWIHPPGKPMEKAAEFGAVHASLGRPARNHHVFASLRQLLALEPMPRITGLAPLEIERIGDSIPLSVLLVEDNLVNQKVALRFLERLGYHADAVANGREAVAALRNRPYDLVFMDLQMPEMDGFEAAREIRQQISADHQPVIIALTANALQGDREACIAAGMDDYITKPVKLGEIAASIQRQFAV